MNTSQSDEQLSQSNYFSTTRPSEQTKKSLPNYVNIKNLVQKCMYFQRQILEQKMKEQSSLLIEILNNNIQAHFIQTNSNKKEDEKKKKVLVFPICIRKSQQKHLQLFSNTFLKDLDELFNSYDYAVEIDSESEVKKQIDKPKKQSTNKNSKGEIHSTKNKKIKKSTEKKSKCKSQTKISKQIKEYSRERRQLKQIQKQNQRMAILRSGYQLRCMKKSRKINIYKVPQEFIPRIALQIRKKTKFYHTKQDISIYFSDQVTQLTPENLYNLEKANQGQCSIIILPTFHSFQEVSYEWMEVEVIPFRLFSDKDLFYSLMYKCICDEDIKAYLPKQSLKLINDFDDFPITYTEGAHRLIYCIERLQVLRQKTQKKFKYVDIKPFLKSIQRGLKKASAFFYQKGLMLKIFIKVMLDPEQKLNLLENVLARRDFFNNIGKDEKGILLDFKDDIVKGIKKYMTDKKKVKACLNILQQNTLEMEQWQQNQEIDFYKQNLQLKLNKIAKLFTGQLQKQANYFSWEQFHFVDTIKPSLPHSIYTSVKNNSKFLKEIKDYVMQDQIKNRFLPKIVQDFTKQKYNHGQLLYLFKSLELHDLICFSTKNTLDEKAYFLMFNSCQIDPNAIYLD